MVGLRVSNIGFLGGLVNTPAYDIDAQSWFNVVEAAGATFGPDATAQANNKKAWSDWVVAQKAAQTTTAGRTNWDALTAPNVGFVQPMMGVSAFNVPPLFGGSTFTGFVAGDHMPAQGPRGGTGKVLLANDRTFANLPLNDFSVGMWITAAGSVDTNRILGMGVATDAVAILADARTRNRTATLVPATANSSVSGPGYGSGTFPRAAMMARISGSQYRLFNDSLKTYTQDSLGLATDQVSFFATAAAGNPSTVRAGVAFCGLDLNLAAMDAACATLSGAIVWPT